MGEWLGGPLGDGVCRASGCDGAGSIGERTRVRVGSRYVPGGSCYLLRPTQRRAARAKAHGWGVRGKPNELKRLDVLFLFQPRARRSPSEKKVQLEPAPPVNLLKVWLLASTCRPSSKPPAQHKQLHPQHSSRNRNKKKQQQQQQRQDPSKRHLKPAQPAAQRTSAFLCIAL